MNTESLANDWLVAADRVYGPLADAFGLRPLRDAVETWFELAAAQCGETLATAQVVGVLASGALDGVGRVAQRLGPGPGEAAAQGQAAAVSPSAWLRSGLKAFDGAMHAVMLSEPGLAATAASVRATSRRRSCWNRLSAIGADMAGQPTRVEVDEAFREIQQLKREVRALKQAARGTVAQRARA